MIKSCSPGVGRCPAVSKGDTLCGFGARPDVYTEAEVHGLYRDDPKGVIRLPARNTRVPTVRLTVQPVSLIGKGIAW